MYEILNPAQVVNNNYLRYDISTEDAARFCDALNNLYANYNADESEEHNKNIVCTFLREAFYDDANAINTYENADLAIYASTVSKGSVPVVLFETKKNGKGEMVTPRNMNRKALHQLVYYYLQEEVGRKNHEVENLVITDGMEWFVFDKKLFLELFAKNRKLVKEVKALAKSKTYTTKDIYAAIKEEVAKVEDKLRFTYFSLNQLQPEFKQGDWTKSAKCRAVYKLLSPTHLLSQPFIPESSVLNRAFYNELLYIMGLKEVMDSKTKLLKIERMDKKHRQRFSLLEQAISLLQDRHDITSEYELFEVALELVMEWINRILFLKLLEGQLKTFKSKVRFTPFMTSAKLPSYSKFYELCMKMLAKDYDERDEYFLREFPDVPYLNSSLFELSEAEMKYFSINALSNGLMKLYEGTKVKCKYPSLNALEYLLRFLGSYKFGNDANAKDEPDTIINAAVLGLIFEKINGYKDGAFFTPGYVTNYICRDVIRQMIIDKINGAKGWNCKNFKELRQYVYSINPIERKEINDIVNTIKVCDIAVGSGHFLVSALNEIILAKHELQILYDHEPEQMLLNSYNIDVANEELILLDASGKPFVYKPEDAGSARVQRALFEEKRTIIENCLFGVDLNPKSAQICCLRLWIELLKCAYYYTDDKGRFRLQTLPNIDINIKHGNSLLSRNQVANGGVSNNIAISQNRLQAYRKDINEYKNCDNKHRKHELRKSIQNFKDDCLAIGEQLGIFGRKNKQDVLEESLYEKAFEWCIEIPEILDEDGSFVGFDIIVCNPPYVSLESLEDGLSKAYGRMSTAKRGSVVDHVYGTYDPRGDLYILFVERAMSLLRKNGRMSFIMPNKWMNVGAGKGLRGWLAGHNLVKLVNFGDCQVFPEATTYTCIVSLVNNDARSTFECSTVKKLNKKDLRACIDKNIECFDLADFNEEVWVTSSVKKHRQLKELQGRFKTLGHYVGETCYYGIKSGFSGFSITEEQRNRIIAEGASAAEIIRPILQGRNLNAFGDAISEIYLVFIPKGFTKSGMGYKLEDAKPAETDAWAWFAGKYPSMAKYLETFKDDAKNRSDKGDYWWELRACTYYGKFEQPKIMYQAFPTKPCFTYVEGNTLCNNSVWFLPGQDKRLLALLNSSTAWWLMQELCPRIQNGCQLIWDNFRQIPVPSELPDELADYADRLIEARSNGNKTAYERIYAELNSFVEQLYGLTEQST